ncbi:hypothetical protein JCM11491_000967 [Sporobolomyces phaffii]
MSSLSAPPPPPPRSASPALSVSRPSTPNFLSQSTSTRPRTAAGPALTSALLGADLATLEAHPQLLSRPEFDPTSSDAPPPPRRRLADLDGRLPDDLTREQAAELAAEWLDEMETVLARADAVVRERPGEGLNARIDQLDRSIADAEKGLENA